MKRESFLHLNAALFYLYTWRERGYSDSEGFPGGSSVEEHACQCRRHKRPGFIPGSGRSPGGGHGNPLQYCRLENPMDREAWRATVHGVAKSQTRLKWLSMHAWFWDTLLVTLNKVKESKSHSVEPDSLDPMDYTVHGILRARILEWVALPFSRGSSQPRDRTQVSHIAGRFLPAEPQGKPKNTGLGRLSLLQQIFLTQESNREFFTNWTIMEALIQNNKSTNQLEPTGKFHLLCFSSSHVSMSELDHKESWVLKNWCYWIVVLEKTLESPLDCKKIKPVNPKQDQP